MKRKIEKKSQILRSRDICSVIKETFASYFSKKFLFFFCRKISASYCYRTETNPHGFIVLILPESSQKKLCQINIYSIVYTVYTSKLFFSSETNSSKMPNLIFLLFMQQEGIQGNESFLFVIFLITFQFLSRMRLKRHKLICSLLYFLFFS
jgi:hypothetical protein